MDLAPEERIIWVGPAARIRWNMFPDGYGGALTLTDRRLVYEPLSLLGSGSELVIELWQVEEVRKITPGLPSKALGLITVFVGAIAIFYSQLRIKVGSRWHSFRVQDMDKWIQELNAARLMGRQEIVPSDISETGG